MKRNARVEVKLQAFLTSEFDGGEWISYMLGCFTSGIHWIREWMSCRHIGERRNFCCVGNRTAVVQSLAIHFTGSTVEDNSVLSWEERDEYRSVLFRLRNISI